MTWKFAVRSVVLALSVALCATAHAGSLQVSLEQAVPAENALHALYAERQFRPVWIDDQGLTPRGQQALDVLRHANQQGLDPRDYHVADLVRLAEDHSSADLARLDAMLTEAVTAYARHLRQGRLAPDSVGAFFPAPEPFDTLAVARGAAETPDIGLFLEAFAPQHKAYTDLRSILNELQAKATTEPSLPKLVDGPSLKPDMNDPQVLVLKQRLIVLGYLSPETPMDSLYTNPAIDAVKALQKQHGLVADGVIGRSTRAILNASAKDRIRQVIATMERWRWMPDDLGQRYVLVNIPAFEAVAVQDGQIALHMPVIVGTKQRPTPLMRDRIRYLELNPTWTVPLTIARKDVLPAVRKDPNYFASQHIQLFDGWAGDAPVVDPTTLDWLSIGRGIGRYRMVQAPGPHNVLGQVKFMFPNTHDIYLHDTSTPEKFEKSQRALSSGCVRVSRPWELADFLMTGAKSWTVESRDAILASGQTERVRLPTPVPVYLFYQTVWRDSTGTVQFREDLYGADARLMTALDARHNHSVASSGKNPM